MRIHNNIVSIPQQFIDTIDYYFIPSPEFINNTFGGIYDEFEKKLPVLNEINNLWNAFQSSMSATGDEMPSFSIVYQGQSISIIDLSIYSQYRSFIHLIIICIAYFTFIRKMIVRIPKFLGGFN